MPLVFRPAAERFHTQLKPGQRMGEWTVDTRESFSRARAALWSLPSFISALVIAA